MKNTIKTATTKQRPLIIKGRCGIGKTRNTIQYLKKQNIDHKLINSYITPLELYKILYNHRDRLIIFDDIEGIFNNKKSVGILKQALESRQVKYLSSSLNNYPNEFLFKGNIFLICNELNVSGEDIEALKDRCLYYELLLNKDDVIDVIRKIDQEENKELIKYIYNNAGQDINIRDYLKAKEIKETHKEWKPLVKTQLLLKTDQELKLIYKLQQKYNKETKKIKEYKNKTGKSRRTYFRKKQKLKTK